MDEIAHDGAPTRQVGLSRGPVEVLDLPAATAMADLPPLVLLHEGLGSVSLWRDVPTAVHAATGRRTVVFSRHGYGRSAIMTEPREVDYMHREAAEALPELLQALEIEAPVLVGHSDGGSIALLYAAAPRASAPTSLVLLAPHVIVEDRSIAGIEQARATFDTTDLVDRMRRHHRDPVSTFRGWNDIWLSPAFRSWDLTSHLADVRCPVLAIQCRDDAYGTLRQLDLIEDGVAGEVERLHLETGGHAPHLAHPTEVTARLVAFLERHGESGGPAGETDTHEPFHRRMGA